jgi:hypothetical protein
MMMLDQKVMFEIYREPGYNRRYRVIYFTELGDANRESEINRAMDGDHYYDGFIKDWRKDEAKVIIAAWVERLNQGEELDPKALEAELAEFIPA